MNSQEAKFILQAFRHNGADAREPHFQEALAQAERDPELSRWLQEDQKLFQLVHRSLRSIPIPPDLKANILAGGKIVRPRIWWRQRASLAVAAGLALLLVWGGFWINRPSEGKQALFRAEMGVFLDLHLKSLDQESSDVQTLQTWLAGRDAPTQFALPAGLQGVPSLGCKVLQYQGAKVSLVCFRDGATLLHLFVMERPDWEELGSADNPWLARDGSWNTAGWIEGHHAFLLASQAPAETLKKYL